MFAWFATTNGRLFTRTLVGFAAAGVFSANVAAHGPLIDKYKDIVSLYEQEKPVPLDDDTLSLAEKVMEDMKLEEKEKKRITFFSVLGHEVFHAGGKNSPWGAIIGLPFNFQTNRKFDLNKLKVAGMEDFMWGVDGVDLLEVMRFSEQAKKFAIAREIHSADIVDILGKASLATIFIILVPARLSQLVNQKFNALRLPFRTRLLLYSVNYITGYLFYYCLKDPMRHISDKNNDEMTVKISKEYLKGGIEFYEKTLAKNKELRDLLGKKGEKLFTREGNENYFLFAPKLPLTKRLENLQEMARVVK